MNVKEYFNEKGCVITGAASGIGFAVTEALLKEGADVFMGDRDGKALASAAERLAAHAGRVHSMEVDVTDQGQVQRLVEDAAQRHGRLDVLFNNAGISGTGQIFDASMEAWRRIIDINLWGVIYGTHFALPIMRRQGGGHIVNTSSICGILPVPFNALYCTTKYAVVGLSESMRFELEDEEVHVSVVCPGSVATAIFGASIPDDAISADEAAQIILAGVAEKKGIIALPEKYREMWRHYWSSPEDFEDELRQTARQRRNNLLSKGTVF